MLMQTTPPKKKTRPVSACNQCHSKKLKCNLKPEQIVCERCASSGKTCTFRIEDMCLALRKKCFLHLGLPEDNSKKVRRNRRLKKRKPALPASPSEDQFGTERYASQSTIITIPLPISPNETQDNPTIYLINLFFDYFGATFFTWLDRKEVLHQVLSQTHSPLLINAMCALAAHVSSGTELPFSPRSSKQYADDAKRQLVPLLSRPSLDALEVLVILIYYEFAVEGISGFWMYTGIAVRMAIDLGLDKEVKKGEDLRSQLLYGSVVSLEHISTSWTNRAMLLPDEIPFIAIDRRLISPNQMMQVNTNLAISQRSKIKRLLAEKCQGTTSLAKRNKNLQMAWLEMATLYLSLCEPISSSSSVADPTQAKEHEPALLILCVLLLNTMKLARDHSLLYLFAEKENKDDDELVKIVIESSNALQDLLTYVADEQEKRNKGTNKIDTLVGCNPYLSLLIVESGKDFLAAENEAKAALLSFGNQNLEEEMDQKQQSQSNTGVFGFLSHSAQNNVILRTSREENASLRLKREAEKELLYSLVSRIRKARKGQLACEVLLRRIAVWWRGAASAATMFDSPSGLCQPLNLMAGAFQNLEKKSLVRSIKVEGGDFMEETLSMMIKSQLSPPQTPLFTSSLDEELQVCYNDAKHAGTQDTFDTQKPSNSFGTGTGEKKDEFDFAAACDFLTPFEIELNHTNDGGIATPSESRESFLLEHSFLEEDFDWSQFVIQGATNVAT